MTAPREEGAKVVVKLDSPLFPCALAPLAPEAPPEAPPVANAATTPTTAIAPTNIPTVHRFPAGVLSSHQACTLHSSSSSM